jgi:hypothetical protein
MPVGSQSVYASLSQRVEAVALPSGLVTDQLAHRLEGIWGMFEGIQGSFRGQNGIMRGGLCLQLGGWILCIVWVRLPDFSFFPSFFLLLSFALYQDSIRTLSSRAIRLKWFLYFDVCFN